MYIWKDIYVNLLCKLFAFEIYVVIKSLAAEDW